MEMNHYFVIQVEYAEIGGLKVNTAKLAAAKKAPNAFKMGRKLLPEFFTPAELSTNTCVPTKPGKARRPLADQEKLDLLLGTYLIFSHFSAGGDPCHFKRCVLI